MDNELPERKNIRLHNYDYSSRGMYFITICTQDRRPILSNIVGEPIGLPRNVELKPYGKYVDDAINKISSVYPMIAVKQYVIMPNHVHLIIWIHSAQGGSPMSQCH